MDIYEYSGSIWASGETIRLVPLTTPFGDPERFLGECGSSAVGLGLLFAGSRSLVCIFCMRPHAKQHTHFPLSQRLELPLETPAKISFCLCRTQWFRHQQLIRFWLNASRIGGGRRRVGCLHRALLCTPPPPPPPPASPVWLVVTPGAPCPMWNNPSSCCSFLFWPLGRNLVLVNPLACLFPDNFSRNLPVFFFFWGGRR